MSLLNSPFYITKANRDRNGCISLVEGLARYYKNVIPTQIGAAAISERLLADENFCVRTLASDADGQLHSLKVVHDANVILKTDCPAGTCGDIMRLPGTNTPDSISIQTSAELDAVEQQLGLTH